MKKPSLRQLTANEQKQVANHEAGHFLAAIVLGLKARAYIYPTGQPPSIAEKCFVGSTEYEPTSLYGNAVIGWSGLVAEDIARNEICHCKGTDFEHLWELYHEVVMSETDRASTSNGGEQMQRKAFEEAAALMESRRRELRLAARILKKHGVIEMADVLKLKLKRVSA